MGKFAFPQFRLAKKRGLSVLAVQYPYFNGLHTVKAVFDTGHESFDAVIGLRFKANLERLLFGHWPEQRE